MTVNEQTSMNKEIRRACELQAKWNGTTVEEEFQKTMSYKKNKNKDYDVSFQAKSKRETQLAKDLEHRQLEKHEAQACRYYNKYVKGIKNPCEGKECGMDCPYCLALV